MLLCQKYICSVGREVGIYALLSVLSTPGTPELTLGPFPCLHFNVPDKCLDGVETGYNEGVLDCQTGCPVPCRWELT